MRRTFHVFGITALFALVAIIHTWPLATDLTHLSRVDAPDAQFIMWAISWVAHRLPTDPLHLFDANIFHPERYTLAYSEPFLVPAIIGAPLHWLGASPIVVYNVLVIVGLVTMALGMYLLTLRFTGDRVAAIPRRLSIRLQRAHVDALPPTASLPRGVASAGAVGAPTDFSRRFGIAMPGGSHCS